MRKQEFFKQHHFTCEVNTMGEDSSFTFTRYVKTFPVDNFKLVWVVLHRTVKEFFKTICQQEQNYDVLFVESFQLALKFYSSIPSDGK